MEYARAVWELLRADADVMAVVGDRIYPVKMPQEVEYPAVVHVLNSSETEHAFQNDLGVTKAAVDITCYAQKAMQAMSIREKVRKAVSRKNGTFGNVVVYDCFVDDSSDDYSANTKLYESNLLITIAYEEND